MCASQAMAQKITHCVIVSQGVLSDEKGSITDVIGSQCHDLWML